MKKLLTILSLTIFTFTSCSEDGAVGPQGPPGPEGPQGPAGEALVGSVFEANIDFTDENEYSEVVEIPESVEIYDSDIVLVYLLVDVVEETGNDVWSLLPQTFYLEEGELLYSFNHTSEDVAIFLDGTADFSTLDNIYTEDQIFRIVIMPAGVLDDSAADASNYNEVMSELKIQEKNIRQLDITK